MKNNIRKRLLLLAGCLLFGGTGCSSTQNVQILPNGDTVAENSENGDGQIEADVPLKILPTPYPVIQVADSVYEFEDGTGTGKVHMESTKSGYSGTGYMVGFEGEEDSCMITVNAEETGFYDLLIKSASLGGEKENFVYVDNDKIASFRNMKTYFEDVVIERVFLEAGNHEVSIKKSWGWIAVDALTLSASKALPEDLYQVSSEPVNANATETTRRLLKYLTDIYGLKVLSGQYCDGGMYGLERAAIWRTTGGQYPAILGLDLMDASPSRVEHGTSCKSVEQAIEYWNANGIVTLTWHWNAPSKYLKGMWYSAFYTEHTNIDLEKIMNGQDKEGYELLLSDIDAIAAELKKLADADVPVLWRPLHEASGGWFWWGAKGAEPYKQLYRLMYDRLTNYHGLNNLIWVWNGQAADWYPGDEYVDIIGEDIYPGERVYTSQVKKFLEAAAYTNSRKMIYLTENGCLFDPDLAKRDGAMWGMFGTWGGEFVLKNSSLNVLSEKYTEESMVKKVYSDPAVVKYSDLPDLKTYPLN